MPYERRYCPRCGPPQKMLYMFPRPFGFPELEKRAWRFQKCMECGGQWDVQTLVQLHVRWVARTLYNGDNQYLGGIAQFVREFLKDYPPEFTEGE